MKPMIRVAVLNHNGGDLTLRCLEHLGRVEWPRERLEVMLVDNGSTDGSAAAVRERHPEARVVEVGSNLGFAAGNNLALRDLSGFDYVALLNNDAFVEPGWLAPLVGALEGDPTAGAANSKILFAPSFREVTLETPSFTPGMTDPRQLGVRMSGVTVGGKDVQREAQFVEGFHGVEHGPGEEATFRWTAGRARLIVPVTPEEAQTCELRVAAEKEKVLVVHSGGVERRTTVGPRPAWIEVPLGAEAFDVINNVGSVLKEGGFGADRGYVERDLGQYEQEEEVFAWCGCSVLLRRQYLEDVGLLDERFFLYYEDTDLSWRGRARGWRHLYVPGSVVRHVHAATSVEWSPLFHHFVDRNRLLMVVKNAPAGFAAKAVGAYLLTIASTVRRDVVGCIVHGGRPSTVLLGRRVRAFLAFLALLPAVLADRRRIRRSRRVPDREILSWMVPR